MKKNKYNPQGAVYTSLATVIGSLLIAIIICWVGGFWAFTWNGFLNILPRQAKYNSVKEVSDFESIEKVFDAQPWLTYKFTGNSSYIFVEVSDLDCINCANFHGYNGATDSYKKMVDDFVAPGKMDYIFIDKQSLGEIAKHQSFYCVAEQNASKAHEYKDIMYKNFGQTFDLAKAKEQISNQTKGGSKDFDLNKFDECVTTGKYKDRVTKLTNFASSKLNVSGTPTFLIFKVTNKEVKTIDNKTEIRKDFTEVGRQTGNLDYDIYTKPFIESSLKK